MDRPETEVLAPYCKNCGSFLKDETNPDGLCDSCFGEIQEFIELLDLSERWLKEDEL